MNFGKDYANIYDKLYSEYDFELDVKCLNAVIDNNFNNKSRKSILNMGSGSGCHDVYLKNTHPMVGVDLSAEMVEIAREKSPGIEYFVGDVSTVNLRKRFDVVLMLSAVLGYQTTNHGVFKTLDNVKTHLLPGGVFIFDVWHGPTVLSKKPSIRVKRFKDDEIELTRIIEPTLSYDKNICHCNYEWFLTKNLTITTHKETHNMRYFFVPEMEIIIYNSGFELIKVIEPCTVDEQLNQNSWHARYICKTR